jgi:hypothetical protein
MSHNGCWFTTALWVLVLDLIVFIIVEWGNGGPDELNVSLWETRELMWVHVSPSLISSF